jgi:hypothetical protein
MRINDDLSRTFSAMIERASTERDPEQLRQLVLAVNILLDVIEKRLSEFERQDQTSVN